MVHMVAESTLQVGAAAVQAWREKRQETAQQAVDEALDKAMQTNPTLAKTLTPDLVKDVRVSVLAAIEKRDDRDIVSAVLAMQSSESTGSRLVWATWGLVGATLGLVIATVVLVIVTVRHSTGH